MSEIILLIDQMPIALYIIVTGLGLLIGSLLNVVIYRLPLMMERSCILGAMEIIPAISFLLQKGRCKHCDCKISVRYPAVELLTALMSLAVTYMIPFGWQLLFALFFTWTLICLFYIDREKDPVNNSV